MTSSVEPVPEDRPYLLVLAGRGIGTVLPIDEPVVIGRSGDCGLCILENEVSRDHARVVLEDGGVWLEDLSSLNGTFLNGERTERARLEDGDTIQVGSATLLKVRLQSSGIDPVQRALLDAARRDPSTGLFDRRYLEERVRAEASYAARTGHPLTVLVVLPDGYGRRKARLGVAAAERFLASLGRFVETQLRSEDVLGRLDEGAIAVVGRDLSASGGEALARRLRRALEHGVPELAQGHAPVTASFGVCSFDGGSPAGLLDETRREAVRAQRDGGNRVYVGRPITVD